jgi:hypothetical protein
MCISHRIDGDGTEGAENIARSYIHSADARRTARMSGD